MGVMFWFVIVLLIAAMIGCDSNRNLITPDQLADISNQCDADITVDIINGMYQAKYAVNKACADGILRGDSMGTVTLAEVVKEAHSGKRDAYFGAIMTQEVLVLEYVSDSNAYFSIEAGTNILTTSAIISIVPPGDIDFINERVNGNAHFTIPLPLNAPLELKLRIWGQGLIRDGQTPIIYTALVP